MGGWGTGPAEVKATEVHPTTTMGVDACGWSQQQQQLRGCVERARFVWCTLTTKQNRPRELSDRIANIFALKTRITSLLMCASIKALLNICLGSALNLADGYKTS